jgi:hypothetical protein
MASVDLPEEIIGEIVAYGVANIHFCGACKDYMCYYWVVLGNYVLTLHGLHIGELYHNSPLHRRRFLRNYMHRDYRATEWYIDRSINYSQNIIVSIIRLEAHSKLKIYYDNGGRIPYTMAYKTYAKATTFTINGWVCYTTMILTRGKVLYSAIYKFEF